MGLHALSMSAESYAGSQSSLLRHRRQAEPGLSIVHLDRRLWHLVQAGYLWDRYGRAVFILDARIHQ